MEQEIWTITCQSSKLSWTNMKALLLMYPPKSQRFSESSSSRSFAHKESMLLLQFRSAGEASGIRRWRLALRHDQTELVHIRPKVSVVAGERAATLTSPLVGSCVAPSPGSGLREWWGRGEASPRCHDMGSLATTESQSLSRCCFRHGWSQQRR